MDIGAWLRSLGLERYAEAFRDNEIDAEVLPRLTVEDLTALGVSAIGHRRKLLDAIAALRDGTPPTGEPAAARPGAVAVVTASMLPEAERRQVTVLFADLTGYTKLSRELDAEELHALLGRFFETVDGVVAGYGGRVDKHIGDCVMAVFGAPVAHGNDAERAVRAALDIQARVPTLGDPLGRPLGVHIGVASGQVIASGTGSASHRAYTVTGESVNLASRLTDRAARGEILISDAVHRTLADRLDCVRTGELAVKGFGEPILVWQLLGVHGSVRADHQSLVGRQSELRQFEAALAACHGHGCGQAIYIRGEAGIGKTRLVEECQAVAERAGFACHTGLVLNFGAGTGQDAIRSIVRNLLGLSIASGHTALEHGAEQAVAAGLVAPERRVYLNDLLDLPQPVELRALYDAMDNAVRNRGKRETVAELVTRASARQPLMLVIEDVHWADRVTLDHLATLVETVTECRALLVMTSRIEGDPLNRAWRSGVAGVPLTTIDLGPLRRREAEALAGAYLSAHAELARRCIDRAGGNPLFLQQLLHHAEETAEAGVPGSIQSLVQARLDRLDAPDKQALQAASILGQRFTLEALSALLQRSDYDCVGLVRHFLVRPQGDHFLFAHALIQEGVYASLLRDRRHELHRRAADWFAERDSVLRAEHLDRAEDPDAPAAYLTAAREQALLFHYERAQRLTERGLMLAREPGDALALTCLKGEILHDLGCIPEARTAYEAALSIARDERERCRAWLGLAGIKRVIDDLNGAFADLDKAEAAAVEQDLTAERARIHFLRGNLYFPRGDVEACLKAHGLSLQFARRAGVAELEAAALGGLGDAEYVRGRMISAHDRQRRCVELSRQHGFGRIEVANLAQIAQTELYFRPQREALRDALLAAEAAAKVGHLRAELNARLAAFFALFEVGKLAQVREQVAATRALVHRLGAWRFETPCLLYLGKIAQAEGHRAEAVQLCRRALAISRETEIRFHGPNVLGVLACAASDPDERRSALAEGEAVIRAGCVGANHMRFYPDAMEAALDLADYDEVERYAAAFEDYTRPEPLPWADFFIARGRALAAFARGKRDAALSSELRRLRDEGERLDLRIASPAIEAAVTAVCSGCHDVAVGADKLIG